MLLRYLKEGEREKMEQLSNQLVNAVCIREVHHYEQEIHKLLKIAEGRLKKCEKEIDKLLELAEEINKKVAL